MIVVDEVDTVDGIPVYYGGDYDDSDYEDPRDEEETVDGIPVYYGGDYDDSDYEDPRDEEETVDGIPVYYGGDFDDSDYEDPHDIFYEEWVDWCDCSTPDGYYGYSRMTGRPSCLFFNCASVMAVEESYAGTIAAGFVGCICLCGRYGGGGGGGWNASPGGVL